MRSIAEMASFLFLLKIGLVYPVWFDRACYARVDSFFVFVFRFGSLDIVGGGRIVKIVVILLIDIVVVLFDTLVCTLIFEMNNAILSPTYVHIIFL